MVCLPGLNPRLFSSKSDGNGNATESHEWKGSFERMRVGPIGRKMCGFGCRSLIPGAAMSCGGRCPRRSRNSFFSACWRYCGEGGKPPPVRCTNYSVAARSEGCSFPAKLCAIVRVPWSFFPALPREDFQAAPRTSLRFLRGPGRSTRFRGLSGATPPGVGRLPKPAARSFRGKEAGWPFSKRL